MSESRIRIGTRNSKLALAQSGLVVERLKKSFPSYSFELVPIVTTGDYRRDRLGVSVEDKKQWVIEIEKQLLSNSIDCAIHSAKDVPLNIENGTALIPVLERQTARDVLITRPEGSSIAAENVFSSIPHGVHIGTSSKRRKAHILAVRPDITVSDVKGNINTRIDALLASDAFFGIILAEAGLRRLEISGVSLHPFSCDEMYPAVGQGQLVAQYVDSRHDVFQILSAVSSEKSQHCFFCERKVIENLEADCHSAVGVYAQYVGEDHIKVSSAVYSVDGSSHITKSTHGDKSQFLSLAEDLSNQLLASGARALLCP